MTDGDIVEVGKPKQEVKSVLLYDSQLTSKLIDKFLYDLDFLKDHLESIEPTIVTCMMLVPPSSSTKGNCKSKVELIAIKRAAISTVLGAAEKALKTLGSNHAKVYKMRFRQGCSWRQIQKKLFISEKTLARRLTVIRGHVMQYLHQVPNEYLVEMRQIWDR